ncbi:MAG TPA: hypothetical protein VIK91_11345, partial [Nannocystis sp.]
MARPHSLAAALVIALGLPACPGTPGGTATEGSATATTSTSSATTSTTASAPTTTAATSTTTEAPTTTAGGEPMRCVSLCESDRDCLQNGQDIGFSCVMGRCVPACASDEECLAELSGWTQTCVDQAGCPSNQICIAVEGEGRCALAPGVFSCEDFGLVELMRPTIAGDMTAIVCGQKDVTCAGGQCLAPCSDDLDCPPQMGHPFCNVETGQCECVIDQDCLDTKVPGFTLCIDGRCGCG